MRFTPVSSVQPSARSTSAMLATESSSNITPAPCPTPANPADMTVSIKIVGTTISLAGMAMIYARRITPVSPRSQPKGWKLWIACTARLVPPIFTLEMIQMTAPAGRANTTARQRTKIVRSMSEV